MFLTVKDRGLRQRHLPEQGLDGIKFFFEPSSIAVAGVSPDAKKLASIIFSNLLRNRAEGTLKADLYPLNPSHARIGGQRCYPRLKELPKVPQLLVVAVPVDKAVGLVNEAAEAGVKAVLMISGGFAEVGSKDLETTMLETARRGGTRILGPNTVGVLDTASGMDSLFLLPTKKLRSGREVSSFLRPLKGGVVIITQSGHLGEIISEELSDNGIGIRALVGTGNQADVSVEEVIRYFTRDEETKAIAVYLEGVRDGRRFMSLAAASARRKPVVVFKTGKTPSGARAALTHTASLVGSHDVYRAAFKASGIVEAQSLQELTDFSTAFALLRPTHRKKVLIVTNAGGVGAVAADEAERNGLNVEPLRRSTAALLRKRFTGSHFISNASLNNPVDLTATVSTEDFARATDIALDSGQYDMALVLPTHQTPAMGPEISTLVTESVSASAVPTCVCVMGRAPLARMIHEDFLARGIPSFPTPERAVRALAALSTYAELRKSARVPVPASTRNRFASLDERKGPLPSPETSRLLSKYGIGEPPSVLVETESDVGKALGLGFPLACKLASPGLLHKAGLGGVVLNVRNKEGINAAYSKLRQVAKESRVPFEGMLVQRMVEGGLELILGGVSDATFGPTVIFGVGGTYAELARPPSLAIAPLSPAEALALIRQSTVYKALETHGGRATLDVRRLASLVSSFSKLLAENPSIAQAEINPLTASPEGFLAVDSRVVLRPAR